MLKESIYNIIIPSLSDNDNICIYNSKSGAIIKLEQDVYKDLHSLIFDSARIKEYLSALLKQGIIVDAEKNELKEIIFEMRARQYENRGMLSLIVAPTLQCNYKCIYCFEDSFLSTKAMSAEEIRNINRFVERYVEKFSSTQKIRIQWFGGEPLLAFENVIRPLSCSLINFAKEKNIGYDAKIITNGYLLNEYILKLLVEECNVIDFQITFDGRRDNYNRMKCPPLNAYAITKQNILSLSRYKATTHNNLNVSIRINVDNSNMSDARLFVEEIKQDNQYKNNFNFYLGRIRGTKNSLDISEFELCENEFDAFINRSRGALYPKKIWCNQYTFNSFCVGPQGELYKCEHDFGCKERVIGNLVNGLYFNEYLEKYMNQPIANCCKECKIFPICLGGCPNSKFHSNENHSCEFTLNNVVRHVEEYVHLKTSK